MRFFGTSLVWVSLVLTSLLCGCLPDEATATTVATPMGETQADVSASVDATADGSVEVTAAPVAPERGKATTTRAQDGTLTMTVSQETSAQQALIVFVVLGAATSGIGVALITPWGGAHIRAGLTLIAGGSTLAWVGYHIPEQTVPAWMLPFMLLVSAVFLAWGYIARDDQVNEPARKAKKKAQQIAKAERALEITL